MTHRGQHIFRQSEQDCINYSKTALWLSVMMELLMFAIPRAKYPFLLKGQWRQTATCCPSIKKYIATITTYHIINSTTELPSSLNLSDECIGCHQKIPILLRLNVHKQ